MHFYSTKNKDLSVSFRQAVLNGIAPDGGLYMPSEFPEIGFLKHGEKIPADFHEIAFEIAREFVSDISHGDLQEIIADAFNFPIPVTKLNDQDFILELFHGPTLAFKDFGARFLARILARYVENESKKIIILVATSGDTGSAVASGFYGIDGIEVGLLYPSGMVSDIQEKQLTTMGGNIHAFEVTGTFDDCQTLVKKAFLDGDLTSKFYLSSANSINIARLLPQSLYYIHAYNQAPANDDVTFCVPSGNFGNLTAGLFAWRMGLNVKRFIAAVNANQVFSQYLKSGNYQAQKAVKTISNAMDVGNPSNFVRIMDLFNNSVDKIRAMIYSDSVSDVETRQMIRECYDRYKYILDPHGAVGLTLSHRYRNLTNEKGNIITLETAHPGKFADSVNEALNVEVEIPEILRGAVARDKKADKISKDYTEFKSIVFETFK
jgi:threonine synthase